MTVTAAGRWGGIRGACARVQDKHLDPADKQAAEEIFKNIDDITSNDDEYKGLNKQKAIERYFDVWLGDFEIANPTSDFFNDPDNCDGEIVCNILTKLDFLL